MAEGRHLMEESVHAEAQPPYHDEDALLMLNPLCLAERCVRLLRRRQAAAAGELQQRAAYEKERSA